MITFDRMRFETAQHLVHMLVFATTKAGMVYVFHVTPEFKLLATNQLGATTNASPAIVGNCTYIRTDAHGWCLGPA